MASIVTICNNALLLVKTKKTITGLTQNTTESNACDIIYDELRDTMLEVHQWNFAVKRIKMSQLAATPDFEWDLAYQLPSDFLRLITVHAGSSGGDRVPYKIENGTVVTDAADLYLRYVARVEDPNLMPATFRTALAKLMASRLAVGLANDKVLAVELYNQYRDEDLPVAKSADSLQDMPEQMPESEWIAVRNGSSLKYEVTDNSS
tara:strand:- start:2741 stop:3358 length:618 start_codon:yes stop_codon:yes gene_type:complete